MKTKKIHAILLVLFVINTSVIAQQWKVGQENSKIGFTVTHMAVAEVDGLFRNFAATVNSPSDDFNNAEVIFVAQVATVNTENANRDNHLKGPDFFDATKFPEITFTGKLVKKDAKNYSLVGDFTMKGVTKKVEFPATYGGTINAGFGIKAGFKIAGTINRQEYGVKWNSKLAAGEMAVSDDVQINCKIELDKAK